jgi:hypothetical protein
MPGISPYKTPQKTLQLTRVSLHFSHDRMYNLLLFPSTITISHMVVNNVGSEEQTIESVPCDSKTVELKPPFELDLGIFPWYNPAKDYSVRHFLQVLQITSFKTSSAPFFPSSFS